MDKIFVPLLVIVLLVDIIYFLLSKRETTDKLTRIILGTFCSIVAVPVFFFAVVVVGLSTGLVSM